MIYDRYSICGFHARDRYGGQSVTTRVRGFTRYTPVLHHAFGAATLLVAIALYMQYDTEVTLWLSDFYPNLQMGP